MGNFEERQQVLWRLYNEEWNDGAFGIANYAAPDLEPRWYQSATAKLSALFLAAPVVATLIAKALSMVVLPVLVK